MFEAEHNPIENRKERIEELKHQLMRAMHSFGVDKITLGRNDIANVYVRFDTVGKDIVEFGSAMSGQSIQDSFDPHFESTVITFDMQILISSISVAPDGSRKVDMKMSFPMNDMRRGHTISPETVTLFEHVLAELNRDMKETVH